LFLLLLFLFWYVFHFEFFTRCEFFLSAPALEKCIGDNWRQFNTEIVQYRMIFFVELRKDFFQQIVLSFQSVSIS